VLDPTNDLRNNRSVERAIFLLNNLVMLPRTRERPESRLKNDRNVKREKEDVVRSYVLDKMNIFKSLMLFQRVEQKKRKSRHGVMIPKICISSLILL